MQIWTSTTFQTIVQLTLYTRQPKKVGHERCISFFGELKNMFRTKPWIVLTSGCCFRLGNATRGWIFLKQFFRLKVSARTYQTWSRNLSIKKWKVKMYIGDFCKNMKYCIICLPIKTSPLGRISLQKPRNTFKKLL